MYWSKGILYLIQSFNGQVKYIFNLKITKYLQLPKLFLILEVWLRYLSLSSLKLKTNYIGIRVWDLVVKHMHGWSVAQDTGPKYVTLHFNSFHHGL